MNSFAALSRACGLIFLRTLRTDDRRCDILRTRFPLIAALGLIGVFTAPSRSQPRARRRIRARIGRRAAGHHQAILRGLPQRQSQDRRRQLRRHHGREHRPGSGTFREGRAQAARPRHAASGRQAAGRQGRRLAGRVARRFARQGSHPGAHHRSGRAASAESQGVRKRGPRSAFGRRQRRRAAAAG